MTRIPRIRRVLQRPAVGRNRIMDGPNVALWQRCHERKNRDKGGLKYSTYARVSSFNLGAYNWLPLTVPQLPRTHL